MISAVRLLAAVAGLLGMAAGAWAQSLLGDDGGSPYDPPKRPAYKKHDFIRIAVREAEPARAAEARSARRPSRPAAPAEASFAVTVEVVDVRPNGTLVVQAIKRRRLGGEEEVVRVTGEVAPSSIMDGAVRLDDVHNLSVSYEGPGRGARLGSLGFLSGLLGKIWPF